MIGEYLDREWGEVGTGFQSLLVLVCKRIPPVAWREVSVVMANGLVRSGNQSTGLERNKAFSCLKAFC